VLRSALAEAVKKRDTESEHEFSKRLARALANRGTELDTAVRLARRALVLHNDADLRVELAGWLAGLGEMAFAAATLRPLAEILTGASAAHAFTRVAVLLGRSGDAAGAAAALHDAARMDPNDAIALELYGAIAGWAEDVVSPIDAAEAYMEASHRREAADDESGAFEDLLRAFDAAPAARAIANSLVVALTSRGRKVAADQVLRQHADALSGGEQAVHLWRFREAVRDGDWLRALGAGFDAALDSVLDPDTILRVVRPGTDVSAEASFDTVLAQLGLNELLAARLEIAIGKLSLERRTEALEQLAAFRSRSSLDNTGNAEPPVLRAAKARIASGEPAFALTALLDGIERTSEQKPALAAWLLAVSGQEGATLARAIALKAMAASLSGAPASLLYSIASKDFLLAGDRQSAQTAAEAACHADTSSARAVESYVQATSGNSDQVAALAIERAITTGVPRSHLCRELARVLEHIGDHEAALAWTQRWLALRPGDPEAARALLCQVVKANDARRLTGTLTWLLSQPEPHVLLLNDFIAALRSLARSDMSRGLAIAERALDVFGPRVDGVRNTVLDIANTAGNRRLLIAVLERQLASSTSGLHRSEALLELCRHRREAGDVDGALRCLVRALSEGADRLVVESELSLTSSPTTGDGQVTLLELNAELQGLRKSSSPHEVAQTLREYGAALWDLAGDRAGAIEVWERAAALNPHDGVEQLGRDLAAFAGPSVARSRLEELARRTTEPREVSRILAVAAWVASEAGDLPGALGLATLALDRDPRRSDMLAIVERAATRDDVEKLKRAYDRAVPVQLGYFGLRALYYRAARNLDRLGETALALRYAINAFEAVPADGATFVLMMQLAERMKEPKQAVDTIARVAEKMTDATHRSEWLKRAAMVIGNDEDGVRQRVDVLLRVLVTSPAPDSVAALGEALSEWVRTCPGDREVAALRFERAVGALLSRLGEPVDARTALACARVALAVFPGSEIALRATEAALGLNPAAEGYAELLPLADRLAVIPGARELAERCLERAQHRNLALASSVLEVAYAIFVKLGDLAAAAHALVANARRHPMDASLLQRADQAVRACGSQTLALLLAEVVPPGRKNTPVGRPEVTLLDAFKAGSIEAGRELIAQLRRTDRSRELVEACRELLAMLPGDEETLSVLCDTLLKDGDAVYAAAIDHVLKWRDPNEALPPPLLDQEEQPEHVHRLLFGETRSAIGDVLGIIWQWAWQLFESEPPTYGVNGVERLAPTSPTILGRLYSESARLLGVRRSPVFYRRSSRAPSVSVLLLSPPSLLVEGDIQGNTSELRFQIGTALALTLPERVLLSAAPKLEVLNVLRAVAAAFGPPQSGSGRDTLASVAQLAGRLWERIPAGEQRRLSLLCAESNNFDYEEARQDARLAARRAGFFICGELFTAIQIICQEEQIPEIAFSEPNALAKLSAQSAAVADLVRLATSPEYAAARWQPIKPQRRPSVRDV
jgi:tetratricopeptide (TPR) repeat protein